MELDDQIVDGLVVLPEVVPVHVLVHCVVRVAKVIAAANRPHIGVGVKALVFGLDLQERE
jgi:hypothetical protein